MARLQIGARPIKLDKVWYHLGRYFNGIREIELAAELGWQRRTLNNYLRILSYQDRVYKEGLSWQRIVVSQVSAH